MDEHSIDSIDFEKCIHSCAVECVKKLRNQIEEGKAESKYYSEHDPMLGVFNRAYAKRYLEKAFRPDSIFTVALLDIAGFKGINSTYGQNMADEILTCYAANLRQLSFENGWFVARYGGDQFLFVIPGVAIETYDTNLTKLMTAAMATIPIQGDEMHLSFFMGVSSSDGETPPLRHVDHAEAAMYKSKEIGKNTIFFYDDDLKAAQREEERIKEKVKEAFENDGFFMVYQPQIDAKTQQVSGYEALIRMKEPGLYPGQFIPVIEKNGWIWKIGRITTELVIKQLAEWRDAGHELHPVSVNYSSAQLSDEGYTEFIEKLLDKYDIPAKYLEIEITEGLYLDNDDRATDLFELFAEMGIRLLMDDFGTGYSSLGYLTYIPVDVIKLDKSLVDTYLVDGKDAFINDVIRLVHDLDKEMIIEGVEEQWQYDKLREFGADTIQGYFFSKPLPADEAIVFSVK